MGSRGGRRIRINAYQNITTKDIVLGCESLDKELSNCNNENVRVWVKVYRTKPERGQRPEQAIKDFVWSMIDHGFIHTSSPANYAAEYWLKDMNLTKEKRLHSQK